MARRRIEYETEIYYAFYRHQMMKKKAREEGKNVPEEWQTEHAQRHMAHKPFGRMP